jgi:hypothetical protein
VLINFVCVCARMRARARACVRACVRACNMLPDGPALVSNVVILKCVPGNYLAVVHSLFMHSVFYLGL